MDDHGSWIPRRFFAIVLTSGSRRFTKAAISFVPRRHLFSPSFLFFFLSFFFHRWNRRNLSDPAGNSILRNYVFSVSFASVSCPYRTILLRRGLPSKRLEFNRWTTYLHWWPASFLIGQWNSWPERASLSFCLTEIRKNTFIL